MLLQEGDSCLGIAGDVLVDKLDKLADEGSQVPRGFSVVLRKEGEEELANAAAMHCPVLHHEAREYFLDLLPSL